MTNEVKRTTGRRKGDSSSRDAILKSAMKVFAEKGYDGASLRAITADAGVDVALVKHFFGDKEGLFNEAVLQHIERNLALIQFYSDDPHIRFAENMAGMYVRLWEAEPTALSVRAVFRAAFESDKALEKLQSVVTGKIFGLFQENTLLIGDFSFDALSADQKELAMKQIQFLAAQLLGVGVSRYIFKMQPISSMDEDHLRVQLVKIIEAAIADLRQMLST